MRINLLSDNLQLLPGMSLQGMAIQDDKKSAILDCSSLEDHLSEVILVVRNISDKVTTLHSSEPCLALAVDQVNLWSCPKCKHGGDREHSRIPGKCKLAPKKDK
ncbi:MAG: hypothetical protein VX026_14410, partial [Myxococcota bacterium]|nr:hypothetical protein [Myxococcota bacterium]